MNAEGVAGRAHGGSRSLKPQAARRPGCAGSREGPGSTVAALVAAANEVMRAEGVVCDGCGGADGAWRGRGGKVTAAMAVMGGAATAMTALCMVDREQGGRDVVGGDGGGRDRAVGGGDSGGRHGAVIGCLLQAFPKAGVLSQPCFPTSPLAPRAAAGHPSAAVGRWFPRRCARPVGRGRTSHAKQRRRWRGAVAAAAPAQRAAAPPGGVATHPPPANLVAEAARRGVVTSPAAGGPRLLWWGGVSGGAVSSWKVSFHGEAGRGELGGAAARGRVRQAGACRRWWTVVAAQRRRLRVARRLVGAATPPSAAAGHPGKA